MLRILVFAVAACAMSGCDRMTAAFTPLPERVNLAFPVPDELSLSVKRLIESTAGDESATQASRDQYGKWLQVRALTCTASLSVARFDTPAEIKKKLADTSCFNEQDALLAEWVSVRRLSAILDKPPLVPIAELPARQTLPALGEQAIGITVASDSNVAVLNSNRGSFTAVRLPDGKAIQTFAAGDYAHTGQALSPNGRVFAIPLGSNRGLKFIDVESGATLWSTDKYLRLTTWLPALKALVLTQSSQGQATVMVDTLNGKATLYRAAEKRPTWSASLPGSANQRLIGGYNSAALMDHARDAEGTLTATQLSYVRLVKPVSSSTPFLMNNGKTIVYVTMTSLAWADLATGDQGVWETSAFLGNGYAKLNESQIYFAGSTPGSFRSQAKVLDVNQSTIAPDLRYQQADGLILPLTPRSGYMRRGEIATIGSTVETGQPEDLQRAIASAQLEVQLAKLKAESRAQDAAATFSGGAPSAPPGAPAAPMLSQVPANAEVAVIGVYESKGGSRGSGAVRMPGTVRVTVLPASAPLVLVLTSYEPVRWVVQNSGRKISAVLLSGYHESNAYGVEGVPVLKIGTTHAYKMDSPDYAKLKKDVARYVANPVRTFQGTYSGQDFSVSSF